MSIDMTTLDIPKNHRRRVAWIKYQLADRGTSLAAFAADYGVTRQCVSQALREPYPNMERLIAGALGIKPAAIWPERYDAQGHPVRPKGRPRKNSVDTPNSTSPGRGRNVKTRRAA